MKKKPVPIAAPEEQAKLALSKILCQIMADWKGEKISLDHIMDYLGDRSFGFLIIILALPNVTPISIPGVSGVLGTIIALLCLQIICGYEHPALPRFIMRYEVPFHPFVQVLTRIMPYLEKIEKLLKPSWLFLSSRLAEKIVSALSIVIAILLALPIPLANQPTAAALILIAIGIISKDGRAIFLGIIMSFLSLAFIWVAGWGALKLVVHFVSKWFA